MEYQYHLNSSGQRLCLLGGHHGLVLSSGVEAAHQQHLGGSVLRGLPGGCFARAWHAVHKRGLHGGAQARAATPGAIKSNTVLGAHQFDRWRGDDCGQERGQARTRGTSHCASLHGDRARGGQDRQWISNAKCKNRGSAVQLCEIGSTLNYRRVCLYEGVQFIRH